MAEMIGDTRFEGERFLDERSSKRVLVSSSRLLGVMSNRVWRSKRVDSEMGMPVSLRFSRSEITRDVMLSSITASIRAGTSLRSFVLPAI